MDSRPSNDRSSLGILCLDQVSHLVLEDNSPRLRSQNSMHQQQHRSKTTATMAAKNVGWPSSYSELDLSDLVVDETIDLRQKLTSPKLSDHLFEPSEITGRSTTHPFHPDARKRADKPRAHNTDLNLDLSTEQILSQSSSEEVRKLAADLNDKKVRQSYGGRTADMSVASSNTSYGADNWDIGFVRNLSHMQQQLNQSEISYKSSNLTDFFASEERKWNEEYGMPSISKEQTSKNNDLNMDRNQSEADVGKLNRKDLTNSPIHYSIGGFFKQRSNTLLDFSLGGSSPAQTQAKSNTFSKDKNATRSVFSDSNLQAILQVDYGVQRGDSEESGEENTSIGIDVDESIAHTLEPQPAPMADLNQSIKETSANKENLFRTNTMDRFLSDTVSVTESMMENSSSTTPDLVTSPKRNAPKAVLSSIVSNGVDSRTLRQSTPLHVDNALVPTDGNRKRNRNSTALDDDSGKFCTPPRHHTLPPEVENVHGLQSKSRLYPKHRVDSDESDLEHNQVTHEVADAVTQEAIAVRSPSPNPSKHSPASSKFSSSRYSSTKSEAPHHSHWYHQNMQFARTGARSISPRLLTRSVAPSQYGSSSDLCNSRNGEISALKASSRDLSWGSTRLRTRVKKHFTIKNVSQRKLNMRMEIFGPGFQILNFDQPTALNLQSQECRMIVVAFCPTMLGPALGRVEFFVNTDEGVTSRSVFLYGFGGNASMQVMGTIRDPHGSPFLCLGDLRDVIQAGCTKHWFTVFNDGPLPGMLAITVKPSRRDGKPTDPTSVRVSPSKCILAPESRQQICVYFEPSRNDLRQLSRKRTPVSSIATLELIYGDEANRQRVGRLCKQMKKDTNQYDTVDALVSGFPANEVSFNFEGFNENQTHISDLFSGFKSEEIVLTLDHVYINDTIVSENDITNDETLMFKTMIDASTPLERTIVGTPSAEETRQIRPPAQRQWSVTPTRLSMNAYDDTTNTRYITIMNGMESAQMFEVSSPTSDLFDVVPSSGRLAPGEKRSVSVRMLRRPVPSADLCLSVFIENDKIDVAVDVCRDNMNGRYGKYGDSSQ